MKLLQNRYPYKKWTFKVLSIFFGVTFFIIFFNFIIDPFAQYKIPKFYNLYNFNQRYLNPGLVKNYKYDTIITGSSMTDNFYLSDFKKYLHLNPLKVPFNGGSIYEESNLIKLSINSNKKLKNVFLGLDFDALININESNLPKYLYDKNIFNDLEYLLNIKTFLISAKFINHIPFDEKKFKYTLNHLYNWQEKYQNAFKLKNVIASYHYHLKKALSRKKQNVTATKLKKNFNFYILNIIKTNPDINFYIFYPPYSIYDYKIMSKANTLDDIIQFKRYLYDTLKNYKNVKLYDFQAAYKITTDITNYKDVMHYNENINKWMVFEFKKDNFLVNNKNIEKFLKIMKNYEKFKIKEN